jgi:hypothetical protein
MEDLEQEGDEAASDAGEDDLADDDLVDEDTPGTAAGSKKRKKPASKVALCM